MLVTDVTNIVIDVSMTIFSTYPWSELESAWRVSMCAVFLVCPSIALFASFAHFNATSYSPSFKAKNAYDFYCMEILYENFDFLLVPLCPVSICFEIDSDVAGLSIVLSRFLETGLFSMTTNDLKWPQTQHKAPYLVYIGFCCLQKSVLVSKYLIPVVISSKIEADFPFSSFISVSSCDNFSKYSRSA